MYDRSNEIEVRGVKIKDADLFKVQRIMGQFSSIRFLYNPIKWIRTDYYEIAYGGKGADINNFQTAIKEYYWHALVRRTFFQKLFNI